MTLSSFKSRLDDLNEPPAFSAKLLRRLWLGLPIAACGLVAAALASAVLVPLLLNLRSEMLRAQRLQFLQDQLNEVNTGLARTQAALKQADTQTSKLRSLLVGGGDRGTVLATLDNEAKATGVRLALYEQNGLPLAPGAAPAKPGTPAPGAKPTPPAGAPASPAPGAPAAPGAPGAPGAAGAAAAAEGVEEKPLLLSVQGKFPEILAFLQRLERLQVMVKQQDLSLAMDDKSPAGKSAGGGPTQPEFLGTGSPNLVMKLSLVVFAAAGDDAAANPAGKPAAAAGQGVRTPPGPPPAGAPGAAGSPPAPAPGNTAPIRPGPGSPPVPPAPPAFPPAGSTR